MAQTRSGAAETAESAADARGSICTQIQAKAAVECIYETLSASHRSRGRGAEAGEEEGGAKKRSEEKEGITKMIGS